MSRSNHKSNQITFQISGCPRFRGFRVSLTQQIYGCPSNSIALPNAQRTAQNIQLALIDWYRNHAEKRLQEKTKRYAKLISVTPNAVGIKSFKSRWGSCHMNGDIVFNWKIIMAPNRIVDYVVVHELCHLKHHDHSPKFWQAVEKVIPDYKRCKEWLKENGRGLEV